MALSQARFLSSDLMMIQGLSAVDVKKNVSSFELSVVVPFVLGLLIHRAELPLPQRIIGALGEAMGLLVLAYLIIKLQEPDVGADQHALQLGYRAQKFLDLLTVAEAHHPLDHRPVVPATVEQDDLPGRGQMGDIALEMPLGPLPVTRLVQGNHPTDTGFMRSTTRLKVPPGPLPVRPGRHTTDPGAQPRGAWLSHAVLVLEARLH